MIQNRRRMVVPSAAWQVPAATWLEIISRYVTFIQIPTWRASIKRDGSEKRACLSEVEATVLGKQMAEAVDRLLPKSRSGVDRRAKKADLRRLLERQGRHVAREQRCAKRVGSHLLRAFLLNRAGYSCLYCERTAWNVYYEEAGSEPPRTLRFEIDHRTTRAGCRIHTGSIWIISLSHVVHVTRSRPKCWKPGFGASLIPWHRPCTRGRCDIRSRSNSACSRRRPA